jgi:hypothetical protein
MQCPKEKDRRQYNDRKKMTEDNTTTKKRRQYNDQRKRQKTMQLPKDRRQKIIQ